MSEVDKETQRAENKKLREECERARSLRGDLAAANAETKTSAANNEWGDALGLDSDEEASSDKNDVTVSPVMTATVETQANDDTLEEARRDCARLREAS